MMRWRRYWTQCAYGRSYMSFLVKPTMPDPLTLSYCLVVFSSGRVWISFPLAITFHNRMPNQRMCIKTTIATHHASEMDSEMSPKLEQRCYSHAVTATSAFAASFAREGGRKPFFFICLRFASDAWTINTLPW
jgi:hypothetical protein